KGSVPLLFVERRDGGDDALDLRRRQLGEDREGENLARRALGFGHVARLVTEMPETLLEVERDRVVDAPADALLLEVCAERVALADADRVLVEDVAALRGADRDLHAFPRHEAGLREEAIVTVGV